MNLLCVVFVILKLTRTVNWPWLWVLCPLWLPYAVWAFAVLTAVAASAFSAFAGWALNLV